MNQTVAQVIFFFAHLNRSNLIYLLIIISSVNLFADEKAIECTREDFEILQQKKSCILKNTDQTNCLSRTFSQATNGNKNAQANLGALAANLGPEFGDRFQKFLELVEQSSKNKSTGIVSSELLNSHIKPSADEIENSRLKSIRIQSLYKIFPEEMRKLEELYNKRRTVANKFNTGSAAFRNASQPSTLKMTALAEVNSQIIEFLAKNPTLKFLDELRNSLETKKFNDLLKNPPQRLVEATSKKVSPESTSQGSQSTSMLEKAKSYSSLTLRSAGGNIAMAAAPYLIEVGKDQYRWYKCKTHFEFSKEEVEYLSSGRFYSLKINTGKNCDEFGLFKEDPLSEFENIKDKFNGKIPTGICKMVKQQLNRFSEILPDPKVVSSSCETKEIKGENFSIKRNPEKAGFYIEISISGQKTFKFPWLESENYPQFITNYNGFTFADDDMRIKHQAISKYYSSRAFDNGYSSTIDPTLDLLTTCQETDTYCAIKKEAAKARAASLEQKEFCSAIAARPNSTRGTFTAKKIPSVTQSASTSR